MTSSDSRQSPSAASGTATAAAMRRSGDDPAGVGARPEHRSRRHPLRHDHRWDGAGDPDPDTQTECREQDERVDRRHGANDPEPDGEPETGGERVPRAESGRDIRADRREQAHAQDRDRREEPAALAGRLRSSRMSGSSGPIARSWGRSATVARNSPTMTAWDREHGLGWPGHPQRLADTAPAMRRRRDPTDVSSLPVDERVRWRSTIRR